MFYCRFQKKEVVYNYINVVYFFLIRKAVAIGPLADLHLKKMICPSPVT